MEAVQNFMLVRTDGTARSRFHFSNVAIGSTRLLTDQRVETIQPLGKEHTFSVYYEHVLESRLNTK